MLTLSVKQYKQNTYTSALIDEELHPWLSQYTWVEGRNGYVSAYVEGKSAFLHRLIAQPPKGLVVDHRDNDPLNNTRSNLRVCTQAQNLVNRGVTKTNKLGVKGIRVRYLKDGTPRYTARSQRQYLGTFSTLSDAMAAIVQFEIRSGIAKFAPSMQRRFRVA